MKFFSIDSPLYKFLSKLLDVLKLNFLWIIFSIPIITIGASTVAAMSVALKMVDDEEGYIGRSFIKAFKENWKQGTMLWIITVIAGYAIYLDFQLFEAVEGNPVMFLIIGMVSAALAAAALIYSYPLSARYENTLFRTIQNSIDISRKYFGRTLLLIIVLGFEFLIFQFNVTMLFFGIILG
ncbi:MAG: YesL family protein, partial [Bacillota bacterium]|nr:YesL family protein [Bacillota bacterium]